MRFFIFNISRKIDILYIKCLNGYIFIHCINKFIASLFFHSKALILLRTIFDRYSASFE